MKAVWTIAAREATRFFTSVTAYIVIALFLFIAGGLFWIELLGSSAAELSMRSFFQRGPLLLAFFVPALTMGLFAEENRARTLELLMTLPLQDAHVVLGKFLGAMLMLTAVLGATLPYAFTLAGLGDLDWGPVLGGYLGLLLLGGAYTAIGVFVSSLTRDQIVAILVTFFVCFVLNILGELAAHAGGGTASSLLRWLSTSGHFQSISRGVIDLRDVVYYLSWIIIALAGATAALSRRRW